MRKRKVSSFYHYHPQTHCNSLLEKVKKAHLQQKGSFLKGSIYLISVQVNLLTMCLLFCGLGKV